MPWVQGHTARKRIQKKVCGATFGKTPSIRGYVVDPELEVNLVDIGRFSQPWCYIVPKIRETGIIYFETETDLHTYVM